MALTSATYMATPRPTPVITPNPKKTTSQTVVKSAASAPARPKTVPTPVPTPIYKPASTQPTQQRVTQQTSPVQSRSQVLGATAPSQVAYQSSTPAPSNTQESVQSSGDNGGDNYDEQMRQAAEAEYNNTINYLSGVESWLKSQYSAASDSTNRSEADNKQMLANDLGIYKKEQVANQQNAAKRREDAISAAKRMYSELQQANKQRFGGSSSAGEATSELLGAEQMRQQGNYQDTFNSYMQQSELSGEKVQKDYNSAVSQIASQATQARSQALNEFTQKMLEIERSRNEAGNLKAQRKLDALYDLRNKQYQINMNEQQFKQNIESERIKAQQQIGLSKQNEQGAFAQLGATYDIRPNTKYKIGQTSFTTNTAPVYVGAIGKYVIGEDDSGRSVYWNPTIGNFEFGWTQYDAGGNAIAQNGQDYSIA